MVVVQMCTARRAFAIPVQDEDVGSVAVSIEVGDELALPTTIARNVSIPSVATASRKLEYSPRSRAPGAFMASGARKICTRNPGELLSITTGSRCRTRRGGADYGLWPGGAPALSAGRGDMLRGNSWIWERFYNSHAPVLTLWRCSSVSTGPPLQGSLQGDSAFRSHCRTSSGEPTDPSQDP